MAGRRINDHSSWVGAGSKGSVFPHGVKDKVETGATGAGGLSNYEDTTEAIKSTQEMTAKKIKSQPMKTGYRH